MYFYQYLNILLLFLYSIKRKREISWNNNKKYILWNYLRLKNNNKKHLMNSNKLWTILKNSLIVKTNIVAYKHIKKNLVLHIQVDLDDYYNYYYNYIKFSIK
jgi:hypothetical protein